MQKNPESAETISKIAGTETKVEYTSQVERWGPFHLSTGSKSARVVESFKVHPNTVKRLRVRECIAIKQYPSQVTQKIQVRY